ncbi:MAG: hypothetical protein GW778_04670 [Alphaproteobacteria bacterium]|nr:hypothetical protein [Alphaproteobacteria bacterium]
MSAERSNPELDLSSVFRHPEMENLVYALLSDPSHFFDVLSETDLSVFDDGNPEMQNRVLSAGFKKAANPGVVDIVTLLRAHPRETISLFLWAKELSEGVPDLEASIKPDDPIMEFFAKVGFLNERATGPANSVFEILGLEIPERMGRMRTPRRQQLLDIQGPSRS